MKPIDSKSYSVLFISLILIFCFQACSAPSSRDQSRLDGKKSVYVSVETFKLDSVDAFGYKILIDGKVYIRQEIVPAIEGNKHFSSREEALKFGRYVLRKIKNKQSPALSKDEVLKLLEGK